MHINRGSPIAGLIGVHVSSKVKYDVIRTISSLFFFYEKILRTQIGLKCKTSNFHPLRSLFARKVVVFVV